ncbi:efflux RND transporter periplasmic adaptor subunit [Rhodobacteraceae bacterium]|nr:efflux RND transporter periplasmic adaptor subunit [Paracoccaceae bacterium]
MIKRIVIAILLLALVAGGIIGFNLFREKMIGEFFANMTPAPVVTSVTEVQPVTWTPSIAAIGTANAAQGTDLSIEAQGVVREITFGANDKIEKGQLLVQIDDRQERADLAAAQATADLAQTTLERAQALQKRGVSAVSALDEAVASSSQARAQTQKLQAALETKQLIAPFGGVIGIPQVELGEFVSPGTVFATLQDAQKMHVDFTLSEQQAGQIKIGQRVIVRSEIGQEASDGKITGIEPKIDSNSRLVGVRAEVPNTDLSLTPGQFMRVRVVLPSEDGVIALPQTVVTSTLYGDSVFVVRETPVKDGAEETHLTAQQVFVTLGRRSGDLIEITDGVAAGDLVVNAGQNRLSPGAVVKIDNTVKLPVNPGLSAQPAQDDATQADAPDESSFGAGPADTATGQ